MTVQTPFSLRSATLGLCLAAVAAAALAQAPNTLSQQERASGWRLLWDGGSTRGFRAAKGLEFPASGWEIKDGVLSVVETGGAESRAGGDIVSEASFAAF
ncbi:MAG TPA: DUF1080 domain-containing protein, partial [Myxococcota bacterium]|nr:DUF1080 domain-containing protein [Myxococcota bacterium]